jgi:hypothetical protein
VPADASIVVAIDGIPDLLEPIILSAYVNNSGKTMNGSYKIILAAHPVIRARQLHIAGLECITIGAKISAEFGLNAAVTAQILTNEKFSDFVIGVMLRDMFDLDCGDIAKIAKDVLDLSAKDAMNLLCDLGYSTEEAVKAVIGEENGIPADDDLFDIVSALAAKGYSANENIDILANTLPGATDDEKIVSAARITTAVTGALNMTEDEIAAHLINVFGGDLVAAAFCNELGFSFGTTSDIFQTAGISADVTAAALNDIGVAAEEIFVIMIESKYSLRDVASAVKDAAGASRETIARLILTGEFDANDVYDAFRNVLNIAAGDLPHYFGQAGSFCDSMAYLLEKYGTAGEAAGYIFKGLGYAFNTWGNVLDTVFHLSGGDILNFVEAAYNVGLEGTLNLFASAGYTFELAQGWILKTAYTEGQYTVDEVIRAIENAYHSGAEIITDFLRPYYSIDEITGTLKTFYNFTAEQAATLLEKIGCRGATIASALKSVYNTTAEEVAIMLKKLGYLAEDIAVAMYRYYDYSAQQIAKMLDDLHYTADEVMDAVAWAVNFTEQAAKDFARYCGEGLGYSKEIVQDVLGTIGVKAGNFLKDIADWFSSWWPF